MRDRRSTKAVIARFGKPDRFFIPVAVFAIDWLGWLLGLAMVALVEPLVGKLLGSIFLWVTTLRLFIIGHEACHGAYVPNPRANKIIGRLAFLPSSIPFSLWELGHNVAHHGYTNFRKYDYVWTPLTPEEYAQLPWYKKLLERVYRSGFGPGLYHLLEVWNKRLFFPRKRHLMRQDNKMFLVDNMLITVFAAGWMALLIYSGYATGQSSSLAVALGFILPWLAFAHSFGISIYLHHTHPNVKWYDDKKRWADERGYITTTVHLVMPWPLGPLMLNVMDHTAHHVDMSIPFHKLPPAQKALEDAFPGSVVVQKFSWKWYLGMARQCQLYDYQNQAWMSFEQAQALAKDQFGGPEVEASEASVLVAALEPTLSAVGAADHGRPAASS